MVRIEKNRIFYIDIDPSNEPEEIFSSDLPAYLGDTVEVGEFVTFSRVFDLIVDNKDLFNTIFAKDLGEHNIEEYLEDYNQAAPHSPGSYDLEVHIVSEIHHYPGGRAFEYYISFHGMGRLEEESEDAGPFPITLSFTSLNELKHKYIRVNNSVQLSTYSYEGDIERGEVYEGEIKLFDFFAAILNEISFFGDPDSRDEVSEGIIESTEAVARGEDDFLSLEEFQEQWKKEQQEAEEEEKRERLEVVKEKISSGYIANYIESTYQETLQKLETLEKDLVSLERYEDAMLVRAKIDKLLGGS